MNVYTKNIHMVLSGLLLLSAPALFAAQIADTMEEYSIKKELLQAARVNQAPSDEISCLTNFIILNCDNPLRHAEVAAAKVQVARLTLLSLELCREGHIFEEVDEDQVSQNAEQDKSRTSVVGDQHLEHLKQMVEKLAGYSLPAAGNSLNEVDDRSKIITYLIKNPDKLCYK